MIAPKAQEIGFGHQVNSLNPESPYPMIVLVESASEPGKVHNVIVHDSAGFATCICKGFQFRHRCRHTIEAVKQALEVTI